MRGDEKVLDILNQVLKNELTAINQFFLHSRMYQNWGLTKLAQKEYNESLDEMKHADSIIQRIFFLEGLARLVDLRQIRIGKNIKEMLQYDLELENTAAADLREGVSYCESSKDFTTRELLASTLASEEEHIDWLETQLSLVERLGIENYSQAQL